MIRMKMILVLATVLTASCWTAPLVLADDKEDLITAYQMAAKYYAAGKYAEAEPLFQNALKLAEKVFGENHENTAAILNDTAILYGTQAKYAEAEPLYQRSLKIRETKLGKDHPTVAQSLNNFAEHYKNQGKYGEAEPLYQRSLKIYELVYGKDHPNVATLLNNIAELYRKQAKYAEAEPLYQRSIKICEVKLGKDHTNVATLLNNLANLYFAQTRYAEAEPLFLRSLMILETKLGKTHPSVARLSNDFATLYIQQSKYTEAEPLYQRSLKVYELVHGKDHPNVALALNNLAWLYSKQSRYTDAEPLFQRSLGIYETKLGKDHPDVANPLLGLAQTAMDLEKFDVAEPLIQRAMEVRRARLGKDHPATALAVQTLANLYARQDRQADAVRTIDRALRSLHKHTVTVLPVLSEKEQLSYLDAKVVPVLSDGFSLIKAAEIREENRLRMAAWLLNSKGVAAESLGERLILARRNQSPEAATALKELEDVRRQLARLTLGDTGATPKQLEELRDREKRLEASLAGFDTRRDRDDPWFELDELRAKLPAKAVFIDIVRFAVTDFKAKKHQKEEDKPQHYLAFLTTARGEVQIVDLGLATPIDAAIAKARKELAGANKLIKSDGEPVAEKQMRESLDVLAKLVLQPLLPHIGTSEQWIISPDSNLWLVPWAALPIDDKTYAIEKHRIQFVTSGRDLIMNPLKLDRKATAPLIIADPNFDKSATASTNPDGSRGLSEGLKLGRVGRLPGTASEAEAITPKLKEYAGEAPRIFTDDKAATGAFRDVKGPRVVVFATHGFFLPEQEKKYESPLLRSGLLLAGCNNARTAKPGEDTGVLSGLEIVGTDLRGTEMVVLSACETGLGDVQNGQGVAGLRQAFQLAGAESVVATLWQIPDVQSAQLMVAFFDNLANKDSRGEALQKAQREIIEKRRKQFGAAHPYYWAAYTLTGQAK